MLLLIWNVLCCTAATIGVSRAAQPGMTLEDVQQSLLVEQGEAILSLNCHQKPLARDDDDKELAFIAPTASRLKLK